MNLFQYHSNPAQLIGGTMQYKLFPAIAYDMLYKQDFSKATKQELKQIIVTNPAYATFYAEATDSRWPEAEPYIMKEPYFAYDYAKFVIKGRWSEAESYIMKEPLYAYQYARYIIQDRWLEAEPFIRKNKSEWFNYKNYFNIK